MRKMTVAHSQNSSSPDVVLVAPAAQLLERALEFAMDRGLEALSGRELAAYAGVSPSAITYHFGSMDGVRVAVASAVAGRVSAWYGEHIAAVMAAEPGGITPEGLVLALCTDVMGPKRNLALLAAELRVGGRLAAFMASDREASESLQPCFERLGSSADQAVTWIDLTYGLTWALLITPPAARAYSWLPRLVDRVGDRLARRGSPPTYMSLPLPTQRHSPAPPATDGARRILDATISLMAEKGLFRLTHRDVAARAEISLASCTYFFATKHDMVLAAVRELYRRALSRAQDQSNSRLVPKHLVLPTGRLNSDLIASQNSHVAVARDPSFESATTMLRDLRGGPVAAHRIASLAPQLDTMDIFIWDTVLGGALHPTRAPKEDVATRLEERFALHLSNLFGGP